MLWRDIQTFESGFKLLLGRGQSRLRFWSQRANTVANGAASVKGETGVSFVRTTGYL